MKVEPIFKTENNFLFFISDGKQADAANFEKINISWSTVELDDEVYNEDFLAKLRDSLKALEAQNKFAILIPVIDKSFETCEQKEAFINAMNHTARRVKDCTSVAGFELNGELLKDGLSANTTAASFMETLCKKHPQYVYFVKKTDITAFNLTELTSLFSIATY